MTRVLLVRHGQTEGFPGGDYVHLTPRGVEQATALGAWLGARGPRPARVVVGPRERQQETWAHLAAAAGWSDAHIIDEALDEIPAFEVFRHAAGLAAEGDPRWAAAMGRVVDAAGALEAFKEVILAWAADEVRPPDLVTWAAFRARVEGALRAHADEPAMRAVAASVSVDDPVAAMELALPVYNSSLSEVAVRGGRLSLVGFNHTPHLGPTQAPTPI
jgi:broad specificity phosphatase PhoE